MVLDHGKIIERGNQSFIVSSVHILSPLYRRV